MSSSELCPSFLVKFPRASFPSFQRIHFLAPVHLLAPGFRPLPCARTFPCSWRQTISLLMTPREFIPWLDDQRVLTLVCSQRVLTLVFLFLFHSLLAATLMFNMTCIVLAIHSSLCAHSLSLDRRMPFIVHVPLPLHDACMMMLTVAVPQPCMCV